jgi:hypothetical protein
MAQRCLPRADARTDYILHGSVEDGHAGWQAAGGHLDAYAAGEDAAVDIVGDVVDDVLEDLLESDVD